MSVGMRGSRSVDAICTKLPGEDVELGGGRYLNHGAIREIRKEWVSQSLRAQESRFATFRKTCVVCGTFNVNGKKVDEDADLSEWLGQEVDSEHPDMFVLGFQEIVDLTAMNIAAGDGKKTKERAYMWRQRVEAFLRSTRCPYVCVVERALVGVLLLVFVRQCHGPHLVDVQNTTTSTGFAGVLGNKGGVCARLQLYDTTFCFVCSHLAAHRGNVEGRNSDYRSIMAKTAFDGDPETAWELRGLSKSGEFSSVRAPNAIGIAHHDVVFWVGDLNYRIAENVTMEEVFARLEQSRGLAILREHDQLNLERKRGRWGPDGLEAGAFQDFEEGELNFRPTYKYEPGTDRYEQRPDKKQRAPAWCDRVLWRSRDEEHVHIMSYRRAERPNLSDHKAVVARMAVKVRVLTWPARREVFDGLMDRLSRFQRDGGESPAVAWDRTEIDFGEVGFGPNMTASGCLRARNEGRTIAYVRFAPKAADVWPWRRWWKVEPPFALLAPGQTQDFVVTATVDRSTARQLDKKREVLEDVLVIRVEGNADAFVGIRARMAHTNFGVALEELAQREAKALAASQQLQEADPQWGVPFALWRVVDGAIKAGLLSDPGIARDAFSFSGSPSEVDSICACVDKGSAFPSGLGAHSFLDAFASFLSALPEAVVPVQVLLRVNKVLSQRSANSSSTPWTVIFLDALAPAHHNTFLYIVCFLRTLLKTGGPAGLTSKGLSGPLVKLLCFDGEAEAEAGEGERLGEARGIFAGVLEHFLTAS